MLQTAGDEISTLGVNRESLGEERLTTARDEISTLGVNRESLSEDK